jgi:hypothetical protein
MPNPLRNVLLQNTAVALNTDVSNDLPVNPLYMILYTLRAEQLAASTTSDLIPSLANLLGVVTRLEVLFRGTTIMSGSLADLCVLHSLMVGHLPLIVHQGDAANNAICVTVPIFLGRPWKKGAESFPATRRGELTLRRVFNSASTNLVTTTITEQVETVEILGGDPASFLKAVTIAKTFVTTGDNDVDFPLGNRILGALLFGTTGFAATISAATWQSLKLLVDGVEWTYAKANWESLQGDLNRCLELHSDLQSHVHTENLAAMYAADVASAKPRAMASFLANYGFLDFDIFEDEMYLLQTAGRGRAWVRATAGTADAARMLPLEIVDLAKAAV